MYIVLLLILGSVFMAKHIGDLIAALTWLSQSHDTPSGSHDTSSGSCDTPSESCDTSSGSHDCSGDKENASYFRECLEDLLTRSYPPVVVKELLILQSAGRGKVGTHSIVLAAVLLRHILYDIYR